MTMRKEDFPKYNSKVGILRQQLEGYLDDNKEGNLIRLENGFYKHERKVS